MRTFYSRFLEAAERQPQAIALEMQRRERLEQVTYAELRQTAATMAAWLRDCGHPAGARIAFLAGNSPRWVTAYLGTLAAGCIAVPLDAALHPDQVARLLRDSGSSLLFTDTQHLAAARQAAHGLSLETVLLEGPETGGGPGAQAAHAVAH